MTKAAKVRTVLREAGYDVKSVRLNEKTATWTVRIWGESHDDEVLLKIHHLMWTKARARLGSLLFVGPRPEKD